MVQWFTWPMVRPLGPFWRYPMLHWIMEYQSMVKVGRKGGWLIILRVFPNSNHQSEGLWVVFSSLQYAWLISQTYLAQVGKHAHLFFETPVVSKNIDLTISWRVENFLRIKFELQTASASWFVHRRSELPYLGTPTLGNVETGWNGLVGWLVGRVSCQTKTHTNTGLGGLKCEQKSSESCFSWCNLGSLAVRSWKVT